MRLPCGVQRDEADAQAVRVLATVAGADVGQVELLGRDARDPLARGYPTRTPRPCCSLGVLAA